MVTAQQDTTHQDTVITAKILRTPSQLCAVVYGHLEEMVDTLDNAHPKGQGLRNAREMFPMVDRFIEEVGQAIDNMLSIYVDFLEKGARNNANYKAVVEREGMRVYSAVQNIIAEAGQLSVHPITGQLKRDEASYHDLLKPLNSDDALSNTVPYKLGEFPDSSDTYKSDSADLLNNTVDLPDKTELYNAIRRRPAKMQMELYRIATQLGPQHGADILRVVEDVLLANVDLLRALKRAGIPIDMNVFPGKEGRFEFVMPNYIPPEGYSSKECSVFRSGDNPAPVPVEPVRDPATLRINKFSQN